MMKLPISLLVLAALGQAVHSKVPPASKTTDQNKSNKRELYEGNYGLRNSLSFGTKFGPTPGIEYAENFKENPSDKSNEHLFGGRVPQISKISDVLTGQGGPFEVAVANHLYSPVSAYQARLSSPTTFEVPAQAQLRYPEQKLYKQNPQYSEQYQQNSQNPHDKEPKPGYRPEYSREESKLLHLETAFPSLEPGYSTPAPLTQDIFIRPLSNIDSHLYPQFGYQHVEQIPLQYPEGTIQPVQYLQRPLVNLVPVQSESDSEETQGNQPTERAKVLQVSTQAPNQEYNAQLQAIASYANFYQNQPYAPSRQYLPVPQSDHNQPQDQYQSVQQSTPQPEPEGQLVQEQDNQHQQYQQYLQAERELPQDESESEQVVQIPQTTPRPEQEHQLTQEIQETLPTQPELETLSTVQPEQHETLSTIKAFTEYSTTPKLLDLEEPSTTIAPYTTHKPLSRMPMAPLRPLPGSRRLPFPRPFSNTLPTTSAPASLTTFSPLPAFRRYPHLNTRRPTSPTPSITFPSLPTITTTPQPDITEILSTQSLPTTGAVSRTPVIRIRHRPLYNQLQSTTPQPTQPDISTLEPVQYTSTFQPSTTLEPETQHGLHTASTPQPDTQSLEPEHHPAPELSSLPQPGVIYHLQNQPQFPSPPPQPELEPFAYPFRPSPQPQLQVYPQPSPPPQSYPQRFLIQPSPQPYPQSFLPPGQIKLYETPVFNLRPQYEPLSTPLPPLQSTELPQPIPIQSQLQPRPDAQEPRKIKTLTVKSKFIKPDETYLTSDSFVSPIRSILHPQIYSQSHEVFIQPDFHPLAAPTFPTVQYFGKYAEAIFGHYHH